MKRFVVRRTPEEQGTLHRFVQTGVRPVQAVIRARILLLANEQGEARNDAEIAQTLSISVKTVSGARSRFRRDLVNTVLGCVAFIRWTAG